MLCGGLPFTVLRYRCDSATNPYTAGASAFGVYQNYAVSVELSCGEALSGEADGLLVHFFNSCHFAA